MLMDKATGNPLTGDDGLPIVGTTEFVPETLDGTIDVEVETDSRELTGHDIVFFEKLSDAEENIIATHEDIEDEGQTVKPRQGIPEDRRFSRGRSRHGQCRSDPALRHRRCDLRLCTPLPQADRRHRRDGRGSIGWSRRGLNPTLCPCREAIADGN